MKRLTTLLLVAGLFFTVKTFAQTTALAHWDLGDSSGVQITGNINADSCFWSDSLVLKDYTGGAKSGPAIRLNAYYEWPGSETAPQVWRWIQFAAGPQAGNDLHVDSISFWLGCYGTHGGMHAAVYWDTDTSNFSMKQSNLLDYDSASVGLPDVRDENNGPLHDTTFAINTDVKDGGVFAFRVYPWYSVTSPSTSKYVVMYLVNIYGTTSPASAIKSEPNLPKQFSLHQNYPNPFNPSTTISFDLPKSNLVTLNVYNLLGQKVATLLNENMSAGTHSVNFNADKLPSGLYFYQLQSGSFNSVKKMMLLK